MIVHNVQQGISAMPAAAYHADPCPTPSLNAGTLKRLITQSPLHAWTHHPRLNEDFVPDESDEFDLGSCAHAMLLEGGDRICVIEAENYRTKAAQEAKAAARAAGQIPVLIGKMDDVRMMVDIARNALALCEAPINLADGRAEQTIIWQEDGIWCRARLDWMRNSDAVVLDYKTTQGVARPDAWIRNQLVALGYDIQAQHYTRGYAAVSGGCLPRWVWLVQETVAPFACSFVGMSPSMWAVAEERWQRGFDLWRTCLAEKNWPAYSNRIAYAEAPSWLIADMEGTRQ